jgi:hypothetical protein
LAAFGALAGSFSVEGAELLEGFLLPQTARSRESSMQAATPGSTGGGSRSIASFPNAARVSTRWSDFWKVLLDLWVVSGLFSLSQAKNFEDMLVRILGLFFFCLLRWGLMR